MFPPALSLSLFSSIPILLSVSPAGCRRSVNFTCQAALAPFLLVLLSAPSPETIRPSLYSFFRRAIHAAIFQHFPQLSTYRKLAFAQVPLRLQHLSHSSSFPPPSILYYLSLTRSYIRNALSTVKALGIYHRSRPEGKTYNENELGSKP